MVPKRIQPYYIITSQTKDGGGIFSITIEASAEVLNDLSNREMFKFIDVKYSEEAEKKASGSDVTLEYIELPFKPDGAL